jgi:hypothetical protein
MPEIANREERVSVITSMITPNPTIVDHVETDQRRPSETESF